MREYLVTLLISAALCYLITPLVRSQAIRFGAVAGIRVGTPSTTIQGMGVEEMKQIATLIARAIATDDASAHGAIKSEVHALTSRFPIYQG